MAAAAGGGSKRRGPSVACDRPKRRRHSSQTAAIAAVEGTFAARKQTFLLVVSGLPSDYQELELQYRFQVYGSISLLRVDPHFCRGYVAFHSKVSADAAIAAAADPCSGITMRSAKVHVSWPNDAPSYWSFGLQTSSRDVHHASSRLLRPEVPLSRRGRTHKMLHITI